MGNCVASSKTSEHKPHHRPSLRETESMDISSPGARREEDGASMEASGDSDIDLQPVVHHASFESGDDPESNKDNKEMGSILGFIQRQNSEPQLDLDAECDVDEWVESA
eukprot:TRINITY_DN2388_c0_g5_i2.p1 TRINITY_DN2388_c0_g5~~TRINITY_DN2388_c0_g5_i2.p1  ORF type:complete len:109 (+),score=13.18 TRINITY_DN2388_c0_g5_i2:150-476(+)